MADELKKAYAHIDAEPAEMDRYRAHLRARLQAQKPRVRWARWLAPPLLACAATLAGLYLWGLRQPALRELEPYAIERLVQSPKTDLAALTAEAWSDFRSEDKLAHRNGTLALCLILPSDQAIEMAAEHLMTEPSPIYRALLLERILDLAEDQGFDSDHIEVLMDREEDEYCLDLYRDWLRLT